MRFLRWLNPEIVIGFMVATIFWIAALGWQAAYSPSKIQQDACYQAAVKAGRNTEECKTFWQRATSDPVAVFTMVLAASTIGLWGATIALYVAGKSELRHLEKTSNKQLRAYIFAEAVQADLEIDPSSGTGKITVKFSIKNWGQTPAYRIRNACAIERFQHPLPSNFIIPSPKWNNPKSTCLGPGQNMFQMPSVDYLGVHDNQRYYLIGLIEYLDAFDIKHTTKFCVSVLTQEFLDVLAGRSGEGEIAFEIAPQHNEAD